MFRVGSIKVCISSLEVYSSLIRLKERSFVRP